MYRDLDDVGQGGVVGGENRLHVGDDLFGLCLYRVSGKLAGDTIEAQTEQVITNMESVLAADHATLADVVKVTVHLSDTALFSRYNAVYARRFSAPYPVRTTVGSDLRQLPGMLIEADCVAYAPLRQSSARKSRPKKEQPKRRRKK